MMVELIAITGSITVLLFTITFYVILFVWILNNFKDDKKKK